MKTIKTKWMILLGIIMTAITFTACGGSDDDSESGGNGSGVNGYYISDGLYTYTDLKNRIEELAKIFDEDFYTLTHPSLFDSDGNVIWGGTNLRTFLRVDDNCIYSYSGVDLYQLGASGTRGMELLYKFDAGEFGTVGFYGFPDDIYVYTREGNKLIVDVGDGKNTNTFLITEGGLILSGGGSYTKYNPNTTY